jgi:hypothetical protein
VSAAVLFAAFGCGSSGTSVSSGPDRAHRRTIGANGPVDLSTPRTVSYRGVEFQVPADWPVYDLEANPSTCVRFDVHAVYLGHAGADMQCPSGILGRTEAVQVEVADADHAHAPSGAVTTQSVNGLSVEVASGGSVTNELDATFPAAGIVVTITYGDTDTGAQQILQTFRGAGQ